MVTSNTYFVKHQFTELRGKPGLSKALQNIIGHQNVCLSAASDNLSFS